MAKIVFYCHDTLENISIFEYYKQDIDLLKELGHEILVCTKYRQIPAEFDLVFVWWWTYALVPVLLAKLKGKPAIITGAYNLRFPDGFEGVDYFHRPFWQRGLIRCATKIADLNLFINQFELLECSSYFEIASGRFSPCVVTKDYLKGPSKNRRMELFSIAWSGRENLSRKGIPELLEAIRILKDRHISVTLNLAGQRGDGFEWLQATIVQYGIENEVNVLGPVSREEKIRYLRETEIYVQPSHFEGFGLGIAEAMGCGACIITCDVGAVRSVVGQAGIYAEKGEPKDLAEKILFAIEDKEFRNTLQALAWDRALKEFSDEKKTGRFRDFLNELGVS